MNKNKLLMMMEIAIFSGLGIILDKLSFQVVPNGGSVSFVMLPIILMALRWGLVAGLSTGLFIGLLQMIFGATIFHWMQAILDYGIAFTVVGFAAIFKNQIQKAIVMKKTTTFIVLLVVAITVGGLLRFTAHLIAGVVFFKEYAGDQNVWLYSIIYNSSYMIPAILLTAVATALLLKSSPKLLKVK